MHEKVPVTEGGLSHVWSMRQCSMIGDLRTGPAKGSLPHTQLFSGKGCSLWVGFACGSRIS